MSQPKIFRNPARRQPEQYKPQPPAYIQDGIEPQVINSAVFAGKPSIAAPSKLNPRDPRPAMRRTLGQQPYATAPANPIGRGMQQMPNVGNNTEQTWTTNADDQVIDDLEGQVDYSQPMIDNNERYTPQAMGMSSNTDEVLISPDQSVGQVVPNSEDNLLGIVQEMEEASYLLIVDDVPICTGPKQLVEEEANALIFGEHHLCGGQPVDSDRIVVLKRIPLKVGLFFGDMG